MGAFELRLRAVEPVAQRAERLTAVALDAVGRLDRGAVDALAVRVMAVGVRDVPRRQAWQRRAKAYNNALTRLPASPAPFSYSSPPVRLAFWARPIRALPASPRGRARSAGCLGRAAPDPRGSARPQARPSRSGLGGRASTRRASGQTPPATPPPECRARRCSGRSRLRTPLTGILSGASPNWRSRSTLACRTGGRGWEMKLDLQTVALVAIAAALWVAVFEGFNAF